MKKNKAGYFSQYADLDLHQHAPLDIKQAVGEKEATGYKSPWNQESANMSLAGTGMYEAGASLMWLRVVALSEDEVLLAGGVPSWASVLEAEEQRFTPSRCPNARQGLQSRLVFPLSPLAVYGELATFQSGVFPGNLTLLSGHTYIYAWYLAMMRALENENDEEVAILWQAALTATFHCRANVALPALFLWSVQLSDARKQEDRSTMLFSALAATQGLAAAICSVGRTL